MKTSPLTVAALICACSAIGGLLTSHSIHYRRIDALQATIAELKSTSISPAQWNALKQYMKEREAHAEHVDKVLSAMNEVLKRDEGLFDEIDQKLVAHARRLDALTR